MASMIVRPMPNQSEPVCDSGRNSSRPHAKRLMGSAGHGEKAICSNVQSKSYLYVGIARSSSSISKSTTEYEYGTVQRYSISSVLVSIPTVQESLDHCLLPDVARPGEALHSASRERAAIGRTPDRWFGGRAIAASSSTRGERAQRTQERFQASGQSANGLCAGHQLAEPLRLAHIGIIP